MIETMAGKSAALHGLCHDATPFTFSEDNSAIDYFGRLLKKGDSNQNWKLARMLIIILIQTLLSGLLQ